MCLAKNLLNKKSKLVITSTLFKTAVFPATEVEEKFLCRSDPCCCSRSRCLRGKQDQAVTGSTSSSLLDTRRHGSDEVWGNFREKKPDYLCGIKRGAWRIFRRMEKRWISLLCVNVQMLTHIWIFSTVSVTKTSWRQGESLIQKQWRIIRCVLGVKQVNTMTRVVWSKAEADGTTRSRCVRTDRNPAEGN